MIEEVNINQDNQFDFSNISKHRINKANEDIASKEISLYLIQEIL